MQRIVVLLLINLSLITQLHAQQWIEHGILDTLQIQLSFKKSENPIQKEINQNLRYIAYSKFKPIEVVKIDWDIILSYQITRQEKGNFATDIYIKPLEPKGDFEVYQFDASAVILPKIQSFRIQVFKEDSSLVYLKYYNGEAIDANSVGQIASFTILHQRWAKAWFIKIDQFELEYFKGEYAFEDWFHYVTNYKTADYIVSELSNGYLIKQANVKESIPFLIKSLRYSNYLQKIYRSDFYSALILNKKDPLNLKNRMDIFSATLDINIDRYAAGIKNSPEIDNLSLSQIAIDYMEEDELLLKLKKNYGNIYDNLFEILAAYDYPDNFMHDEISFFELISSGEMDRVNILKSEFEKLFYEYSIAKLDLLIENQNFSEALFYIENLESFRENSENLIPSDKFEQRKSICAYGMYKSYANVIDKALEVKNLRLAEQYIEKAVLHQKKYASQIISNALIEEKILKIIKLASIDLKLLIQQNKQTEVTAKQDTIRHILNSFYSENTGGGYNYPEITDIQLLLKNGNRE